jgi:hypothetical protein
MTLGAAPMFVALASESEIPAATRALGAFTWFLCTIPAYLYLSKTSATRRPLPFLQTISFVYGLYFALPIALGEANHAWRVTVDPTTGYDVAMQLVFFGWFAMMLSYNVAAHFFARKRPARDMPWRPSIITKWASLFLIFGIVMSSFRTLFLGAAGVGGFLQLFVAMQWLGLGLLTVLARRGELNTAGKIILVGGFSVAVGVALSQGNVSPVVMLCVMCGFGLWVGRQTIEARWIIAAVFSILLAISFRGVIRDFRLTAWFGTREYSQVERMELMATLLMNRIETEGIVGTLSGGGSQTAQRSAQMDVFADVIRRTPDEVPYWKGETYYSLIGAVVPRFLWRDKPTKELGQAFGHRYRYLDPTNTSTAINLPILTEFYVNFGAAAVVLGMLVVGATYGVLDSIVNRPGQSPMLSMFGLTLLLPLLLIESDFSLVFGGLPLSGLALWGIWIAMRRSIVGNASSVRSR